jgi:hypothetical protein
LLGIGVFLGDRAGAGRTFQQVPDGPFARTSCECYEVIRANFERLGL